MHIYDFHIFPVIFLLISRKAGRAKQIEKRSVHSRLVNKKVFLQYKIINCPNNRSKSKDIFILLARYFIYYFLVVQLDNRAQLFADTLDKQYNATKLFM